MEIEKNKAIIEAMLFASGIELPIEEFMSVLELGREDVEAILEDMKSDYQMKNRGIELIKVENAYQLATKKEYYNYIYPLFDKRSKPNISNAAMETLSIVAYNPKITRAEIEAIRGVNSDGTIYKLLEYNLIQEAGKKDAPGRPTMYVTNNNFLKMFGLTSLDQLPELPKYKIDENEQIVIDDLEIQQEDKEESEKKSEEESQE